MNPTDIRKPEPRVREQCPHCKATWLGDGWTVVCPVCGKQNGGNR